MVSTVTEEQFVDEGEEAPTIDAADLADGSGGNPSEPEPDEPEAEHGEAIEVEDPAEEESLPVEASDSTLSPGQAYWGRRQYLRGEAGMSSEDVNAIEAELGGDAFKE
jgi:hypothetical protein